MHITLFYKNSVIEINSSGFLKLTSAKSLMKMAIRMDLQLQLGSKYTEALYSSLLQRCTLARGRGIETLQKNLHWIWLVSETDILRSSASYWRPPDHYKTLGLLQTSSITTEKLGVRHHSESARYKKFP